MLPAGAPRTSVEPYSDHVYLPVRGRGPCRPQAPNGGYYPRTQCGTAVAQVDQTWGEVAHTQVLTASVHSPEIARDVVARLCTSAAIDAATVQTVLLLTSEVVTNAVTHGAGSPVLSVTISADVLRVSVADDDGAAPYLVSAPGQAVAGGRGIYLIETLASRWGSDPHADSVGKNVWFELDR